MCQYHNQAVRGKFPGGMCPDCGTTKRLDHSTIIPTAETDVCPHCDGEGLRPETRFDSIPQALWDSLAFVVHRSDRVHTLAERLLGLGAFSVTDYGEHKTLSDEALIAKVRDESHYVQALKVCDEGLNIANHMGIFCSNQGYSVVAVYD